MSTSEIQLEGKANVNGKFENKSLAYAYVLDPANNNGAPVSHADANAMIVKWWQANGIGAGGEQSGPDPINIAVAFDKQLLLLMLSQQECEGIRFYFCTRPDNQRQSLVMVGMDKAGNDLGQPISMDKRAASIFGANDGQAANLVGPTILAEVGTGKP